MPWELVFDALYWRNSSEQLADIQQKGGILIKAMVLYCSNSGTTEKLSRRIQGDLDCNTLKIMPEEAYGNYFQALFRFMQEKRQNTTPKASTAIPNLQAFDTVFIGYPIWGGDMPPFFKGFLQKCNLAGKTVIPFATSGRTGIEKSVETLKSLCPASKIVRPLHMGLFKQDDYDAWMQEVGKKKR